MNVRVNPSELVVATLEDAPLFNAGRGSVFTADGLVELDAAIMDGKTLAAGALAGARTVCNPVKVARTIMDRSGYVLLAGEGADRFARAHGPDTQPLDHFFRVPMAFFGTGSFGEGLAASGSTEAPAVAAT